MSDFGDLRQFLARDLVLAIDGDEYTVTAPNAEKGLEMMSRVVGPNSNPLADMQVGVELLGGRWDDDKKTWVKTKGSTFAKLMKEQDWDTVHRVAMTSMLYFLVDKNVATRYWRTGSVALGSDDDDQESSPSQ